MTRTIRVFFSSPGDLEEERQLFGDALEQFSVEMGVSFVPLGWESLLSSTHRRPQSDINALVDQADVFLAAFFRRWGQPAPDTVAATSYTEEEFNRALHRRSTTGSPTVFCWFKNVDPCPLLPQIPQQNRAMAEERLRRMFGEQFQNMMVDVMAESFTVGELMTLANFYRGEGASVNLKAGRYMGAVIPRVISTLGF